MRVSSQRSETNPCQNLPLHPPVPAMANSTSHLPPVLRPRARHTAFWISKGGKDKGNPHPNLQANTHTYTNPPSLNNNPLCPSCLSKPHKGHAWRVWISGISIQCHAPWDPVRGPLEYISIALSPCITMLIPPLFNIKETFLHWAIMHVSAQQNQSRCYLNCNAGYICIWYISFENELGVFLLEWCVWKSETDRQLSVS